VAISHVPTETKRFRLLYPHANDQIPKILYNIARSDRDDVVFGALDLLEAILKNEEPEEQSTVAFYRLCGHLTIVQAMKYHPHSRDIQFEACSVIKWLCFDRGLKVHAVGGLEGMHATFGSIGLLDCLKDILRNFPTDEGLNNEAIIVLNNILFSPKNVLLFHSKEDVMLVVQAMKQFPDHELIQQCGCRIMKLVYRKGTKKMFRDAGALTVIGSVLDRFSEDNEAHKQAVLTFNKIVGGP
jgi:hypothetical protein